jgi:hypothetical protein
MGVTVGIQIPEPFDYWKKSASAFQMVETRWLTIKEIEPVLKCSSGSTH